MTTHRLTRSELEGLHSVLRRAAERAERAKQLDHARKLLNELDHIAAELAEAR